MFTRLPREWLLRLSRVINPSGFTIAVLGVDGSGKSSVIERMCPILEKIFDVRTCCEHMRPNFLPSLASLLRRPIQKGPVLEPHGGKPSGFYGSLLRLSYYTIDYIVGYWAKIFPAIVKRSEVYIFDRYFYDYQIDPRRSLISLPRWIIQAFGLFVPKTDIILCLLADPEIIHARKPELPIEEIKRQTEALRKFCNGNKKAVWIDTGRSIQESIDQALEAITLRMAARYE